MDTNSPDNQPLAGVNFLKPTFTAKDQLLFPIYAKGLKKYSENHYCFVFMNPTTCLWLSNIAGNYTLSLMKNRYDFYREFLAGRYSEITYGEMQGQFQPLFDKLCGDLPKAESLYGYFGSLTVVMSKGYWLIQPGNRCVSYYEHPYEPGKFSNVHDKPVAADLVIYQVERINLMLKHFTVILQYQPRRVKDFDPSYHD